MLLCLAVLGGGCFRGSFIKGGDFGAAAPFWRAAPFGRALYQKHLLYKRRHKRRVVFLQLWGRQKLRPNGGLRRCTAGRPGTLIAFFAVLQGRKPLVALKNSAKVVCAFKACRRGNYADGIMLVSQQRAGAVDLQPIHIFHRSVAGVLFENAA